MQRFIIKRINKTPNTKVKEVVKKNNNIEEKTDNMNMSENIAQAQEMAETLNATVVKRVKKEKGLMEKTTTDKVVLMEDNRQVLND